MYKYFLALLQELGFTDFIARVIVFLFSIFFIIFFIIWMYMYFAYPVPGKGGFWYFLGSGFIALIIIFFFTYFGFKKGGMSSLKNSDVKTIRPVKLLVRVFKSFYISGFFVAIILIIADIALFEIGGYDLMDHEQLIWLYYLAVAVCFPIVYRQLKQRSMEI